jgi:hypothetical protein
LFVVALGLRAATAQAVEVLVNGALEADPIPVPGWTLTRTVTGEPSASVNSAQLQDFANQPMSTAGQSGLWLRSWEGNVGTYDDQNKKVNALLSQNVPGAAGETYTFAGWSRFEQNFSGGADDLDSASPSGGIPSPTGMSMELAFLDAGNDVLGMPVTLNVKSDRVAKSPIFFANDNAWYQHSLMGAAPAGTASVRVTASMIDGVFNIDPGQSGFYDNFSLKAASAPSAEILTNADLNTLPSSIVEGWTLTTTPSPTTGQFQTSTFANHTPGGATGLWLRPFLTADPVGEAFIEQIVEAEPGGDYTLSAFSKWEVNYTGAQASAPTQTLIELAFLDASEAVIGTPVSVELRGAGQVADNMWRQFSVNGVAPAGTVSVRAKAGAKMMFNNAAIPGSQSAFFDDLSLMLADSVLPGDFNGDGSVDAADYVVWRKTDLSQEGYNEWRTNFGRTSGGAALGASAVPEPACLLLIVAGLAGILGTGRRSR